MATTMKKKITVGGTGGYSYTQGQYVTKEREVELERESKYKFVVTGISINRTNAQVVYSWGKGMFLGIGGFEMSDSDAEVETPKIASITEVVTDSHGHHWANYACEGKECSIPCQWLEIVFWEIPKKIFWKVTPFEKEIKTFSVVRDNGKGYQKRTVFLDYGKADNFCRDINSRMQTYRNLGGWDDEASWVEKCWMEDAHEPIS